jgi:hypothetical protein
MKLGTLATPEILSQFQSVVLATGIAMTFF